MYVQCLHVCLDFVRRTTQPGHNRFFLIPPKNLYSNQATQKNTCQIFVPQKIPESKISNPKKSFDHPRHLKSRVPPLGSMYYFVRKVAEFCWVFSFVEVCTKLNLRNLSVKMTEASNCTELEQVVHTHRTLCQSNWPMRAGLPKSQSSLLNISFHFGDTCSHCTKVFTKPIRYETFHSQDQSGTASLLAEIALKSLTDLVWKVALSGEVFKPAQKLLGIII